MNNIQYNSLRYRSHLSSDSMHDYYSIYSHSGQVAFITAASAIYSPGYGMQTLTAVSLLPFVGQ